MTKRIYLVTETTGDDITKHLVKASSQSAAIQFVVKGRFTATTPTTMEMADLMLDGLRPQEAGGK